MKKYDMKFLKGKPNVDETCRYSFKIQNQEHNRFLPQISNAKGEPHQIIEKMTEYKYVLANEFEKICTCITIPITVGVNHHIKIYGKVRLL